MPYTWVCNAGCWACQSGLSLCPSPPIAFAPLGFGWKAPSGIWPVWILGMMTVPVFLCAKFSDQVDDDCRWQHPQDCAEVGFHKAACLGPLSSYVIITTVIYSNKVINDVIWVQRKPSHCRSSDGQRVSTNFHLPAPCKTLLTPYFRRNTHSLYGD
jgi:hypothetical protein